MGRRTFLRVAASGLIVTGYAGALTAGCGGSTASRTIPLTGTEPGTTGTEPSTTGSVGVRPRAPYEVSFLFGVKEGRRAAAAVAYASAAPRRGRQTGVVGVEDAGLGKINNLGEVAALLTDQPPDNRSEAGIYRNGTLINANLPSYSIFGRYESSFPRDLNDRGQLLIQRMEGNPRLYLWDNGVTALVPLPYDQIQYFFGEAINNHAHLVGSASHPDKSQQLGVRTGAFIWKDGKLNVFGQQGSVGQGINDAGQIVGSETPPVTLPGPPESRAVLWQNETASPVELGVKATGGDIRTSINQDGAVLIVIFLSGADFQYTVMNYLWVPESPNAARGNLSRLDGVPEKFYASDFNRRRDIVGNDGDYDESTPYLIPVGEPPVNLNGLIAPDSGWVLEKAHSINDVGQITGRGYYTNPAGEKQYAAFLLTPTA
ncbi:MAG: hypothetical protein H8F28_24570 [Fibrella sp.]|nr:hypothetical protein [Armatimonadota bacterium]